MDLTQTIIPKSDQINAEDLLAGPVTVTIAEVRAGDADQPVNVITAEYGPGRAYRPSKSMRRVMVAAWGPDSSTYTGRRMTLYREPSIKFGSDQVGGIRISHMSDLKDGKVLKVALTVTRGKRALFTVQPLADAPTQQTEPTAEDVAACTDQATLRAMWGVSGPERQAQIQARAAELAAEQDDADPFEQVQA